ncbi:MAG: histidinol-phosphatase [Clostridiales bacterium]|nr:histidinol-phosphatase [Clostridiales bacterium]
MTANYHTHTWRCRHAEGDERAYVEAAIERGIRVLGFSDHTPYPFPKGYVSGMRMRPGQLEDYVTTVLALREEYRKDIEIYLGLEAEYFPARFDALLDMVKDYPLDYFLLGQHFLDCETTGAYAGYATPDPAFFDRYCRQVMEALETGCFACWAHPDLVNFTGAAANYEEGMRKLCRRARELDIPLEINLLGLHEGRHYPQERFWKIAGQEGAAAILGIDAHAPEAFCHTETAERARALAKKYGLSLQDTVRLRHPAFREKD